MIIDLAKEADFRLGDIQVRPSTRQIESGGVAETLEPRIMQVLVALARKRGQVVSRDELIETCWEGRIVGDDALNRCISKIRKLGEARGDFRLETIPRVGYRLWAEGSGQPVETTAPNLSTVATPAEAKGSASLRRTILALVAVAVLATASLVYWAIRNSRTVDVTLPMVVAVLRFDAPADGAELQQFAGAVSQAVADSLTRSGQRLVPTALSMELTGERKASAAEELNAHLLVDGYVSREKGRARIVVRLDHARDAFTVWSSTLEGPPGEPNLMGQRLSAQIMSKLNLSGPVRLLNSDNPQAVERARTWLLALQRSDDGDDRGAMEGTKRLEALWPDSAHPHYMRTIETMDALPSLSVAERLVEFKAAKESARKAVEVDRVHEQESTGPFTATARATPAYAWRARIKGLEDAIATGRTVPPRGYLADNYLQVGRATAALEITGDRPATGKSALITRARVLLARGDKTGADRDLADGRDIWPLHPVFPQLSFESAAWLGSVEEAGGRLAETGAWSPPDAHRTLLSLILAARRSGNVRDVDDVEEQCSSRPIRRDQAAQLHCLSALTVLGRRDAAFAVIDVLYPEIRPQTGEDPDERWLAAPASSWDPVALFMPWTASLRSDPHIVPVFERLGLLDYWRETGNWPDFCESEPQSVCEQMKGGQ